MLENVFHWQTEMKSITDILELLWDEGKMENLSKKTHFKQSFSFGLSGVSVGVHFEKAEVVAEALVNWFC